MNGFVSHILDLLPEGLSPEYGMKYGLYVYIYIYGWGYIGNFIIPTDELIIFSEG
jgi:hypothetical protein